MQCTKRPDFEIFSPSEITEMLPGILNQLGAESLTHLKRLASNVGGAGVGGAMEAANNMEEEDDDEVPDLVENFDEVSKNETATEDAKISEVPGACYHPFTTFENNIRL